MAHQVNIPVITNGDITNGDITNADKVKQALEYTGESGVIVGRAT